jgi:DNA-nicking Smr family endonuclease
MTEAWHRYQEQVKPKRKTHKKHHADIAAPPLKITVKENLADIRNKPGSLQEAVTSRGLSRTLERGWREGTIPIERRLDLHGYTLAHAETKVHDFVQKAYHDGCRHLLIVTGKGRDGRGAIKENLPDWLASYSDKILAIRIAAVEHGGAGARYIYLRKKERG